MTIAELVAQARCLAANDHLSHPPGAPESNEAKTLRACADALEQLDLERLRAQQYTR